MKKNNQSKAYSSEDYLANLRRNNIYGVDYYNDINEFASENEFNTNYFKEEDKKKETSKKCECNHEKEQKSKKSKK